MTTTTTTSDSTTVESLPKVANLRAARKEGAALRKAAAPAKAAAKKTTPVAADESKTRKTPATSGKPKLRWQGDIASADGEMVGLRVEKAPGLWEAVVKVGNKKEVLASGVSRDRAYAIVTRYYHYSEKPAKK